jgi:putative transcriptional regulator
MTGTFTESVVEQAALAWLESLGWTVRHGLEIAPGEPGAERAGKRTLRTHAVAFKPAPELTPKALLKVRESLHLSRALFATCLRTNPRALENWEQGRAKPNAQAVLLINLVKRFPDTVGFLASI